MDGPSAFFFALERKNQRTEVLSQAEFIPRWHDKWSTGNPYSCAFILWGPLLCWTMWWSCKRTNCVWFTHLSEENQQTLDNPISFAELSLARSCPWAETWEITWSRLSFSGILSCFLGFDWEDLVCGLSESFNQGKLPLSCWRAVVTLILKKEISGS